MCIRDRFFAFAVLFTANATYAQEKTEISQVKPINVEKQMKGFDEYANKLIKDWNCPGIGVGIVYKGKLVFAKGYGYRDYGKKLPVTPNTLFRIASNRCV